MTAIFPEKGPSLIRTTLLSWVRELFQDAGVRTSADLDKAFKIWFLGEYKSAQQSLVRPTRPHSYKIWSQSSVSSKSKSRIQHIFAYFWRMRPRHNLCKRFGRTAIGDVLRGAGRSWRCWAYTQLHRTLFVCPCLFRLLPRWLADHKNQLLHSIISWNALCINSRNVPFGQNCPTPQLYMHR